MIFCNSIAVDSHKDWMLTSVRNCRCQQVVCNSSSSSQWTVCYGYMKGTTGDDLQEVGQTCRDTMQMKIILSKCDSDTMSRTVNTENTNIRQI